MLTCDIELAVAAVSQVMRGRIAYPVVDEFFVEPDSFTKLNWGAIREFDDEVNDYVKYVKKQRFE